MQGARRRFADKMTPTNPIAEKVIALLAAVKRVPRESISLDSSLADLNIDSLDTITLLFELEKEFQLSISDDQVRAMRSVRQIVEGVQSLLAGPRLGSTQPANG
jgi:acyl carrier protein